MKKIIVFTFAFSLLPLLSGCSQKNNLQDAQSYIQQAQGHYQRAIGIYKDLIAKGKKVILVFGPGHKGKEYLDISSSLFYACTVENIQKIIEK